ncbi:MAG: hypothetical protein JXA42_11705 [Anaerolineales bacterium]|nr:hypothetical protein [Anaerolineales bacterium]
MQKTNAYVCTLFRSPHPILLPEFKLGGSPVFYQTAPWPVCSNCGQEMDFLAQVPLQNPVQFSSRFAMAYIFMCPGHFDERGWQTCETWDPNSGANKVIIQERSEVPVPVAKAYDYPDYAVELVQVSEPMIDTSDYSHPEEVLMSVHGATKLGGVPSWVQDNETPNCPVCHRTMRFVAQFDAELDGPLPADPKKWNKDDFKFFQFGDVGIGYLFICPDSCSAKSAVFLW